MEKRRAPIGSRKINFQRERVRKRRRDHSLQRGEKTSSIRYNFIKHVEKSYRYHEDQQELRDVQNRCQHRILKVRSSIE